MSSNPSPVETIKRDSDHLRGSLAASLADPVTGTLAEPDQQLIKFHGSYQQDDRDLREERRKQKLEPAYRFMIRTRLPGGVCTPAQWQVLDGLAQRYGNGTLRLTTRQAFQLHGVVKRELKATIAAMNAALVDSIAACGDVNRNVLASATLVESPLHEEVHAWARRLSEHLLPRTRAYHEIWLDEQRVAGGEDEPIYGPTYLPRKFKAAFAVPPLNDVDVFAQDLGFVAIIEDGALSGFNLTVGGGLGATHGDATTRPMLAQVAGFLAPENLLAFAEAVVTTQRDFGERGDRRHARLKYTIAARGIDWFRAEIERRAGVALAPARPFRFTASGDRLGWQCGHDGRWHLTVRIESGRVADQGAQRWRSALAAIAGMHRGDFRLTPNQNLVIAGIEDADRAAITALLDAHGVGLARASTPLRQHALACVAMPTCPLAMAEAERYLPALLGRLEQLLGRHGLARAPITLRMTGCPNGCARPYLAEIGLVGKGPGRYNLHLGGDRRGQRLNRLYRENLDEAAILAALDPLLARYAAGRRGDEGFGDFVIRIGEIRPLAEVDGANGTTRVAPALEEPRHVAA